ncbi:MAG: hypothetical protein Q7W13_16410 [Bacteroidia bacterium]|nr:hypothetical protein [Bacteroidia bacterium]
MEINYNSEWFESGYYVYVLIIEHHKKGRYYYVGMTGDRNHISARSPFYRMMGHFNTYNLNNSSHDSQLVAGLRDKKLIDIPQGKENIRVCVERAITNKIIEVRAKFNKIRDFDPENHKVNRIYLESVELNLIKIFEDNELEIFNKDTEITDYQKNNKEALIKAKEIFNNLNIKK